METPGSRVPVSDTLPASIGFTVVCASPRRIPAVAITETRQSAKQASRLEANLRSTLAMSSFRHRAHDRSWRLAAFRTETIGKVRDILRQHLGGGLQDRLSTCRLKGNVFSGVFCAQSEPCSPRCNWRVRSENAGRPSQPIIIHPVALRRFMRIPKDFHAPSIFRSVDTAKTPLGCTAR